MSKYNVLTEEQVRHFLDHGHVFISECFLRETAIEMTDMAFKRLGYDKDDPETWVEGKIHMPSMNRYTVKDFSPKAWGAFCDLLGGEDRILEPENNQWGDGFIVNFHFQADQPYVPPSREAKGWHKDGDFFRHFLDSPEQGLLTIVMWSDIQSKGGATYVATDSVKPVAQYLHDHPEGVLPGKPGFGHLVNECTQFTELTGKIGDVVLIHPYVLHASSQNMLNIPRFITNPPVKLKEPMNFNRDNPADFSPVEQAILNALDVERLDFKPTAEREAVVPERVRRQAKMLEEEKARLATQ